MNLTKQKLSKHSKKEIRKIKSILKKINAYQTKTTILTDAQLQSKTNEFKNRYQNGENLDKLLPEVFAVIREADKRVLGMEPYDTQLLGGIILHQGRIAEMKTGEGKTLVATLPAYLNAITCRGVHIVTVNDYLAKRDSEQMGQVHRFMGLSVGCVLSEMSPTERKTQYDCDITYITNSELGFDYLRDNMSTHKEDSVQRGLVYAIIDEVDSVLIDEARTPLVISGASGNKKMRYAQCDTLAKALLRGEVLGEFSKLGSIMGRKPLETGDYIADEKDKYAVLTENGIKKTEQYFNINNLSDPQNIAIQHGMTLALRANALMCKDKDYVVKNGEILIVDEFTGRIMDGRRYSDGLHQAIEAKEGVEIKEESQTLATITYQNFFNKYEKKSGMTGTGQTEEQEFRNIYYMDVVEVPTFCPVIRKDLPDVIYMTKQEKFQAVCDAVEKAYKKQQPVLIGTVNIDTSEMLGKMLSKRGIPHKVLNAKNNEQEAEIVAVAGLAGQVTIATNMAGRGTDIKLDKYAREYGGLKVIGTERHDSRRIDNQLRGRSGRQGDPGTSQFYLSLEDDLLRVFGSEKTTTAIKNTNIKKGETLSNKMFSPIVEMAQKKIEDNNYGIRKNVLEYDLVNNKQREIIYAERERILSGENTEQTILKMLKHIIKISVLAYQNNQDITLLNNNIRMFIPIKPITEGMCETMQGDTLIEAIEKNAIALYMEQEKAFAESEHLRILEKQVLLRVIDTNWKKHLEDMEQLKQWIGIKAYGQKDPKLEYKRMGYQMFKKMLETIYKDTVRAMFTIGAGFAGQNFVEL